MSGLVFAIPSKGRLKEQAEAFLADCGLRLVLESRGYTATMKGAPNVDVRLMSSGEIAQALRAGAVHAGICGEDLLRESEPAMTRVALVRALGFGPADLVVAAPKSWFDVATMADLDAVCHDFRARTGARLRVATKYPALARAFFDEHGLDDYRIVQSDGATEGAPAAGAAETIVDITTTGATLAANHLKILKDGVILKSQAQLAASLIAPWDEVSRAAFHGLTDKIEARLRAKAFCIVRAALGRPTAEIAAIAKALGARVVTTGAVVELECASDLSGAVAAALLAAGASDVLVLAPSYIFATPNEVHARFHNRIAMTP
ncbi:MAG TPA: ATP phosphoribosyltransferase [Caulobacterales bacterium]|nr:ATP phosphoribosyltransferase [Caulobacterales bacterium]